METPLIDKKNNVTSSVTILAVVVLVLASSLAVLSYLFFQFKLESEEMALEVLKLQGHFESLSGKLLKENDIQEIVVSQLEQQKIEAEEQRYLAAIEEYKLADEGIADSPIYGAAKADYTIVEFADVECPFCKRSHPELMKVVNENPDNFNLTFHHFPLVQLHPQSVSKHMQTQCIFDQSNKAFWAVLDNFYNGSESMDSVMDTLKIDKSAFRACITGNKVKNKISQDLSLGSGLGISSTPTTFIIHNPSQQSIRLNGYNDANAIKGAIKQLNENVQAAENTVKDEQKEPQSHRHLENG